MRIGQQRQDAFRPQETQRKVAIILISVRGCLQKSLGPTRKFKHRLRRPISQFSLSIPSDGSSFLFF